MLGRLTLSTLFVTLAACGTSAKSPDAAATHDSPAPDAQTSVQTVTCPATPDATVTITTVYVPMVTTITAGQIVQFVTQASHDVTPDTGQDPGVHVPFSKTECKKYTTAGTFSFHCSIHGFMGSVVVN